MPNLTYVVGNDAGNALAGSAGGDLIYGFDPGGQQSFVDAIAATRVAAGLTQPVFAGSPPGDFNRLFVVEKTGRIKILDLTNNQVQPTDFLDLSAEISTAGECGLLGLAFDPNFAQNGYFYVNLINAAGDTEIRRYQVAAGDPAHASPAGTPIISIDQPAGLTNHKAGWLGFGPDGYLYAALGDGGGSGDPLHSGQDMASLLGKMLRLDVHGDDFPGDPTRNYAIPGDNPFVGAAGVAPEIWALGLRNPWRDSFDRAQGDLFIADVGQNRWEEVDIGQAGANYGWNVWEGPERFADSPLAGGSLTFPIHFYSHSVGHSITGGYVYRGTSDGLQGQYFFADFVDNRVFTLRQEATSWSATERTAQINTDVGVINNVSSFGEDGRGDLYAVDFDGEIFRLMPVLNSGDHGDQLSGLGGNDVMFGGAGDDRLDGGSGADVLNGGSGFDYATYASAGAGVVADLSEPTVNTGDAGGDTYILIEGLIGSRFADNLVGDSNNNAIDGRGGNDTLSGEGGDDRLVFAPGSGADVVTGFVVGAGSVDKIILSAFPNLHTLDDVLARATQNGANTVINFGNGDTLTLQDVSRAALSADDLVLDLFQASSFALGSFGVAAGAGGWRSSDEFPRRVADVNGDGRADILGFGEAGVYVALGNGGGSFQSPSFVLARFGTSPNAGGWTSDDKYPRQHGDINGDGRDDIVGFGDAGAYVAFGNSDGSFQPGGVKVSAYGRAPEGGNWSSFDTNPRVVADVNGDGCADIVGFADGGVSVSYAHRDGSIDPPLFTLSAFGAAAEAGGWTSFDKYPRQLADVNGDGRADILGFGDAGVYVALANSGGTFELVFLGLAAFGASASAGGWISDDKYPRRLGDVNGDGRADIVGFGDAGIYAALGQSDGTFGPVTFEFAGFSVAPSAGGWSSNNLYPRVLADVTGDGAADIVGFGHAGVFVSPATGLDYVI